LTQASFLHIFWHKLLKNLADGGAMRNRTNPHQMSIEAFKLPFAGELNRKNRWVKLAEVMPWDELSTVYNQALSERTGRPGLPSRVVVGALIIKHLMTLTDEETIEQIRENPYLQYFLGYPSYSYEHGFDSSLFVTIRKRLGEESVSALNQLFIDHTKRSQRADRKAATKGKGKKQTEGDSPETEVKREGMLLVDATVAPSDIRYPTDIDLLNQARKVSEHLIDVLYEPSPGKVKPRTYRRKARKAYLSVAKKRRKSDRDVRRGIKAQLGFLRRNIRTIDRLLVDTVGPFPLSYRAQRRLWIIREVYRQQEAMYRTKSKRIDGRIVSISQPHVRPIVRGKAGAKVEFGAKISASVVGGNVFLDRISWDAFNESGDLPGQVENYRKRFECYPEVVISDTIYGTRDNRRYLKKQRIRYSGTALGRPSKDRERTRKESKRRKKEAGIRNEIEGIFGVGKRRFGLGQVMTKLRETSES
jgi:transposase, IS5 family